MCQIGHEWIWTRVLNMCSSNITNTMQQIIECCCNIVCVVEFCYGIAWTSHLTVVIYRIAYISTWKRAYVYVYAFAHVFTSMYADWIHDSVLLHNMLCSRACCGRSHSPTHAMTRFQPASQHIFHQDTCLDLFPKPVIPIAKTNWCLNLISRLRGQMSRNWDK